PNLESGKAYSYTITVKKTGLEVSGCTITDWETGSTGSGVAEITNVINLSDLTGDTTVDADAILTGTTSHKITLNSGVTVALHNATINGGIVCERNAKILLFGTNTVTCNTDECAGIQAGIYGTTLTIDGEGELTVKGGNRAAGIGCGEDDACGNIIINGGTVTATGGEKAAGIGSGRGGTCGNIIINGGTVTATGADLAAGIGSGCYGYCDDITINGVSGMIVKAGICAACVGTGFSAYVDGTIKVTNSTVTLDKSATGSTYFNPTPSDTTGSTFRDAQTGEEITSF
ncbi:MAG: hypothetical protein ACI3YC_03275, partial [Alloprevotella sp.]